MERQSHARQCRITDPESRTMEKIAMIRTNLSTRFRSGVTRRVRLLPMLAASLVIAACGEKEPPPPVSAVSSDSTPTANPATTTPPALPAPASTQPAAAAAGDDDPLVARFRGFTAPKPA
jgi:hypothetical protein